MIPHSEIVEGEIIISRMRSKMSTLCLKPSLKQ